MLANSRRFTLKAVTWAVTRHGIGQVIDLGCGRPPGRQVHHAAQEADPAAVTVYVDLDWQVTSLLDAEHAGDTVAVAYADFRDPAAVLADPDTARVYDPEQPALVLASLIFHQMPVGEPEEMLAAWAAVLAPGSAVAVTVPHVTDPGMLAALAEAYVTVPARTYDPAGLEKLLEGAGFEVVPPGAGWAAGVELGAGPGPKPGCGSYVIAGAGLKP
jgi:trans-aconitate methyltransferase